MGSAGNQFHCAHPKPFGVGVKTKKTKRQKYKKTKITKTKFIHVIHAILVIHVSSGQLRIHAMFLVQ